MALTVSAVCCSLSPIRGAARMEPFETLSLCAEIAIAITGFSGVVLVFSERSGGTSPESDRFLFRTLFTASLIPLGLIAVAQILDASELERAATWRISSIVHLLAAPLAAFFNIRDARRGTQAEKARIPRELQRLMRWVLLGALLVLGLQLANAISLHSFWPVLIAVWWGIAVSLSAFVSLLSTARAAPQGVEPDVEQRGSNDRCTVLASTFSRSVEPGGAIPRRLTPIRR